MYVAKAFFAIFICFFTSAIEGKDISNPLSIGGNYVSHGDCPWLCPVYKITSPKKSEYICGSSIINNQYVVTAAHCVSRKQINATTDASMLFVISGIHDLNSFDVATAKTHYVQEVKIHPKWDITTQRYDADIALIKLTDVLEFNKYVQRIALPNREFIKDNFYGFVVGYGKSETESNHENVPRRIRIPVVDPDGCYQNNEYFSKLKSRDAFCAGRNGVVPCNGDSGSSFYLIENSSPVLLGIVSVGISNTDLSCKKDAFVLFTDIYKFNDWIKKEIGSGFVISSQTRGSFNTNWKRNDVFCEYANEDGYLCTLRGVRSQTSDTKISSILGEHQNDLDDDDVINIRIIEQQVKYIPEMSEVVEKFKRIQVLRIWTCGLKYIERSKLAIFAKRLRVLDLFNNHIEEIPADAFNDLTQLQQLKVLNNRIRHLPENLFHNLRNLKWFSAEYNEIEELPEHLFDHTQIVEVIMKNNWLKRIYVDFRKLRNLNVIDFNQNSCIDICKGHYCGDMSIYEFQEKIEEKCKNNQFKN